MKGQWLGSFQGTNSGLVNINIDEKPESYSGVAYFFDEDRNLPLVVAHFEILKNQLVNGRGACTSNWINPLDPPMLLKLLGTPSNNFILIHLFQKQSKSISSY